MKNVLLLFSLVSTMLSLILNPNNSVVQKFQKIDPRALNLKLSTVRSHYKNFQRSIKQAIPKIGKHNLHVAETQGAMINNIEKQFEQSKRSSKHKYQHAIKEIRRLMGKNQFNQWAIKLKKSGITVDKLPLESLDQFVIKYKAEKQQKQDRRQRKLLIGFNNADHSLVDYNIKDMSGGSLSVRFPDLPRAIVVNQTPYYQYS